MDSYFIHQFIIIKYSQVRFRVKSANYYKSYGPFFNLIFCKMPACGWGWPWAGASVSYWHISSLFKSSSYCFLKSKIVTKYVITDDHLSANAPNVRSIISGCWQHNCGVMSGLITPVHSKYVLVIRLGSQITAFYSKYKINVHCCYKPDCLYQLTL